jgi:hypothetical protein
MIQDHHSLEYLLEIPWVQQHIDDPVEFPNMEPTEGRATTALHLATTYRILSNVFLLLSPFPSGPADVNRLSAHGRLPLSLGIKTRSLKLVHALLAAGADPDLQSVDGEKALDVAKSLRGSAPRGESVGIADLLSTNSWSFDFDQLKIKYAPRLFARDPVRRLSVKDETVSVEAMQGALASLNWAKARVETIQSALEDEPELMELSERIEVEFDKIRGLVGKS